MVKAISLISGGLDSILATRLILDAGVDVLGLTFKFPFLSSDSSLETTKQICKKFNIKCRIIDLSNSKPYFKIIEKPKFGYGKNLNPCIDCHLFMLKTAKKVMREEKAEFIITGDVLGERPMSQRKDILKVIDKEAGLSGRVLRPLSAQCLEATIAENNGLIDRSKFLAIQGRSRKEQFRLANIYRIDHYPTPGGGCLLTERQFCKKVEDLINHKSLMSKEVSLLKVGRHFRLNKKLKLVVGRSEVDNRALEDLWQSPQILLKSKSVVGPSGILCGLFVKKDIMLAASIIASFTKGEGKIVVEYFNDRASLGKDIQIESLNKHKRDALRI